jgi:hypothetical protein
MIALFSRTSGPSAFLGTQLMCWSDVSLHRYFAVEPERGNAVRSIQDSGEDDASSRSHATKRRDCRSEPICGSLDMTFSLRSSAFSKGEPIPAKYTADGENLSPPLEWSDPPAGTKSFALIV